jgi:hypothetical protein
MIAVPDWIPYRRAGAILQLLSEIVESQGVGGSGPYVLAGPPNNGKTAIVDRLQQLYLPIVDHTAERSRFPVLALDMPPTPSLNPIFRTALRKLGAPLIACPLDRAIAYLRGVLAGVRTRLIAIDDSQHILAGDPLHRRSFLEFWRDVAAGAGAALLLVGSADVLTLAPNAQLLSLPAWPLDAEFEKMARALEHQLSPKRVVIGAEDIPTLHSLCSGRLGALVAATAALSSGAGLHSIAPWEERFQKVEHAL